jgi:signal transduction histidine kinase
VPNVLLACLSMKIAKLYNNLFEYAAKSRLENGDLDPRRIHCHAAVVITTSILMWAYALIAYFTISSPVPGIVGIVCSLVHLLSPLLYLVSPNVFLISSLTIGAGIIHQGAFAYFTGGFQSFILIWFGILPMLTGVIAGKKAALFWGAVAFVCAAVFLGLHISGYTFPNLISPTGEFLSRLCIVFGLIILSTSITYVLVFLNDSKEKLMIEQGQNIEGLFRVLFHDLAGPLARISIGLEIAKDDLANDDKKRGLKIATNASNAMLELTQNVRDIYTLTKAKAAPALIDFPLNEAVDYLHSLYISKMERKNIQLDYDFNQYYGLCVLVDPISFKNQVLGNALSNAIKFSPLNSKITIRAYPHDDQFHVIEIVDQGIGIPASLITSLFDINKRSSRIGTSGELGSGFGMHIMKNFMDMYQGKIEIESNARSETGTVIKLYLKAKWS